MAVVNRRLLRTKLGSRSARRAGTKSQAIPGTEGKNGKFARYQYWRRQRPAPRTLLAELVEDAKKAAKKAARAAQTTQAAR